MYLQGRFLGAYLFHLVGDRFGVATTFYHADYSAPTGFVIIFDGGLRVRELSRE
jgi:hypothetical protein